MVVSMTGMTELNSPVSGVRLFASPVHAHALADVPLADADEVATFATEKRRNEHLSGRWLLGQALMAHGERDLSALEVRRSEQRAPSLAFIQGAWRRTPLPSISIAHSGGRAVVALGPAGRCIGIDLEPLERALAQNAFDLIAKGEELEQLRLHPEQAMRLWTGKEAVQKAMGLGMHLNPRDIQIPIDNNKSQISIEKSKIQLVYWSDEGYHFSLASRPKPVPERTPEDVLLDQTKAAMNANPDWGVGCNTQRNAR